MAQKRYDQGAFDNGIQTSFSVILVLPMAFEFPVKEHAQRNIFQNIIKLNQICIV